jgi:hypothetical protein
MATSTDRHPNWWGTTKAVLWGFLGVRKKSDYQQDIAKLSPLHLMAVGLLMAFLFVALLMGFVHWVASA